MWLLRLLLHWTELLLRTELLRLLRQWAELLLLWLGTEFLLLKLLVLQWRRLRRRGRVDPDLERGRAAGGGLQRPAPVVDWLERTKLMWLRLLHGHG